MAIIPTIQPRGSFDVPGSPAPHLANPMAEVGMQIGDALNHLASGWSAARNNALDASFSDFQFDETKALDAASASLKPGDAAGFAGGYDAGFQKRAQEWLARNGAVAADWQPRLNQVRLGLFRRAAALEEAGRNQFAGEQIDGLLSSNLVPKAARAASLPDGPTKAAELQAIVLEANKFIDNSTLSEAGKEDRKLKVRRDIEEVFAGSLPPAERISLSPTLATETVADRIVSIEGTGKNPESSAEGPGQFIDSTWLHLVKAYRPDLAQGMSDAEILALRTGPAAGQIGAEMTRAYSLENAAYLQHNGIEASAGNLYLAHFLGPQGAVDLIKAPPEASAAEINPAAAKANPSIFFNAGDERGTPDTANPKTAAQVAEWAAARMGGVFHNDWGRQLSSIPWDQRAAIANDGMTALVAQRKQQADAEQAIYEARLNALKNGIEDGSAGEADIAAAYDGGKGWLAPHADDRHGLVTRVHERDKTLLEAATGLALIQGPVGTVNPFDDTQKRQVNAWYDQTAGASSLLQGGAEAVPSLLQLRTVVERAQFVPASAVARLQQGIYSPDLALRSRAMTVMDGLARENPSAYVAAFGQEDRRRVDVYQRLSTMVPSSTIDEELDPTMTVQRRQERDARMAEGRLLAGKIDSSEILGVFDANGKWPGGGASMPGDALAQTALRTDFEDVFAEAYARVPTEEEAKKLALKWVGEKWGATDVGSGGRTLMAYPPEKYYPHVDGSFTWMDAQLEEAVHAQYPDAKNWWLVTDPQTEADVSAKTPPAYRVMTVGPDGAYRLLGNRIRQGGPDEAPVYTSVPALVRFDYRRAEAVAAARFNELRRVTVGPDRQPHGDPLTEQITRGLGDAARGGIQSVGRGWQWLRDNPLGPDFSGRDTKATGRGAE
jgi:hypothetical protein